jgi:heptaprenyl diphosphate synthase
VTDFWKDSPALERRLGRVVAVLEGELGSSALPIREAVAESLLPGGKLLRPALLLIGSGFGKAADPGRVERLAAAA